MTSEERREVAERLRERERGWRKMGTHLMVMPDKPANQFEDIASLLGFEGSVLDADVFGKLADLIDPTCQMVVKNGHACCGRCGHRLADEWEKEEGLYEFRPYCPDCGCRVVGSDDESGMEEGDHGTD